MSINFQQIHDQIKKIGASAHERKKNLDERSNLARIHFNNNANNLDGLRYKVELAKAADPGIRCALPLNEPLDFHAPSSAPLKNVTLIAADGSQIFPDRHHTIQYGLINVGTIVLRINSGIAPIIRTESEILFDDRLFTSSGAHLTDGMLALERDLEERSRLYDLAKEVQPVGDLIITLTDGPIELWGAKDGEEAILFEASLTKYLAVLSKTQELGAVAAGYIDKPSSDLLIRLLEVSLASDEEMQKLREYHPLRGVTDRWLFGDKDTMLLKPGERSAVFGFQSKSEKYYKGVLSLHFFYLNISANPGNPQIARVDIPKWVVDQPDKLDVLHALIIQQCKIMGSKPFPYLLHRAHECAVVSFIEKQQVDSMLFLEQKRNGVELGDISNKQSAKDLPGRTRY